MTRDPRTRRLRLAGALLAVLLVLGGAALVLTRGGSAAPASASAPTAHPTVSPAPTDPGRAVPLAAAAPTAVPSTVLAGVPGLPAKLAPVPLAAASDLGHGVTARLTGIRSYTARGAGVGEFSGPALRVTVELTNSSSSPVSLATASVGLYAGADGTRAAPVRDGQTAPFSGQLAPGATVSATYAFSVPVDQRGVVTVTVGTSPATGTAVFSGAAA